MEVYQERSWISNDTKVLKGTPYDRHRILPSRVIAEYCPDETPTIASVWVSYHEAETVDLPAAHQYSNDEDGSFAWVAANADALYEQYPDRWILIDKARVVNSASEPEELMRSARILGIKEPFITMTSPPELPGKAVYGGKAL